MKKQMISGLCVLSLAACGSNSSLTLGDLLFSGEDEKNIVYDNLPVIEVEKEAVVSGNSSGDGYYLAKRGDRYASAEYVITPQVYAVVATRAANKMLAGAPAVFAADKNAPLYIADTEVVDRYLPEGHYAAGKTVKEILYGSEMFNIIEDESKASYVLKSSLNNINTPEIPVLSYKLELYDAAGKLVGSWSDNIRRVMNDDGSWW